MGEQGLGVGGPSESSVWLVGRVGGGQGGKQRWMGHLRVLRKATWPVTSAGMHLFAVNAPPLVLGAFGLLKPWNGH